MMSLRIAAPAALVLAASCGPDGSPPSFEAIEEQHARVGEDFLLELRAVDPDGSALAFSFRSPIPDLRERAELNQVPGGAVFRWRPEAGDVGDWFIDFFVTDGNFDDQVTVPVRVEHAAGEPPRFLRPAASGDTFALTGENACVEVDVEIDAPAATQVAIREEPPAIEGADLEQTAALEAVWTWCPSDDQLAAGERYELRLSADDGVHAPTIKDFLIILEDESELWIGPYAPGAEAIR